ncbi:MAG: DUF3750 domain-containing protein [Geminicoccaceae bacterium]|nr:DUF3750 domain-containing protein [Geminicoccaceae bacterium]MDW8342800.1 DUF3750 domain-containing protein [Geminicoccaceae bacterium]
MKWLAFTLLVLLLGPVGCAVVANGVVHEHWSRARWSSAGILPDPSRDPDAVVQVWTARTWGWKGAFAVHSWIVLKEEGANAYERFEVVGWGVSRGLPAVRKNLREPDAFWAGNPPELVAERRGRSAAEAIPKIRAAIAEYPWADRYLTWPGPNSNTFVAWVLRRVPELAIELPPTAIGKDFLGLSLFAPVPSGTGYQLSLAGLAGIAWGAEEGLELNLLGLVVGLDPRDGAVKLPGLGRIRLMPNTDLSAPGDVGI